MNRCVYIYIDVCIIYIYVYYIQSMSTELRSGWWCFGLDMHGYHWFLYNTGSLTLTNQTLYIYWLSLNPNLDGLNMIEPQNPDTLANEDIVIFIHKQINAIYQAISSKKTNTISKWLPLSLPPQNKTRSIDHDPRRCWSLQEEDVQRMAMCVYV